MWKRDSSLRSPRTFGILAGRLVAFLLGCSFPSRGHLEAGVLDATWNSAERTHVQDETSPACPRDAYPGPCGEHAPHSSAMVHKAVLCTGRFPAVHGAPVHIGGPSATHRVTSGSRTRQAVPFHEGEAPVLGPAG